MFIPKTDKIKYIFEKIETSRELDNLFNGDTAIYLDWANMLGWSDRLKFHIDVKRLKQFLDSFSSVVNISLYYGKIDEDKFSNDFIELVQNLRYKLITKPVKILRLSIDASSIENTNPALLKNFIKKSLLRELKIEQVENLNDRLKELNHEGILKLEERKCNFDVEIGRDMILDAERGSVETFVLWSGDGDFASVCKNLIDMGKKVVVCTTSRKVTPELNQLVSEGLFIFEVKKIKEFICNNRELSEEIKQYIENRSSEEKEIKKLQKD